MSTLFGPGWGNYAIAGIVETEVPDAISLIPSTPGWWVFGAGAVLWGFYTVLQRWQRHRANAYRRAALATLQIMEQRYAAGDVDVLRNLAGLLRATAIQASHDRSAQASLRGSAWAQQLHAMAPNTGVLPCAELEALAYVPLQDCDTANRTELFAAVRDWLEQHDLSHA